MDKQPNTPRWADRFLGWFLPSELYEELLGDLHEQFALQTQELGEQKARWMYFFEVLRFCRPYFLKRRFRTDSQYSTSYTYSPAMIRNYFKIAWRNLFKNKMYGFINVGGLAVGMAVAMLIGLWVWDEVSYDHSFKNYDKIAIVRNRFTEPLSQETRSGDALAQPISKILKTKYAHFFKHISLFPWAGGYSVKAGEKVITKTGQFLENGAIDMFSLKMLVGDKESLTDIQSIIISESTAKALFEDQNAINQVIKLNNKIDGKITGVYADFPKNSTFGGVGFIGNFENLRANNEGYRVNVDNWGNSSLRLLVQLADNVSLEQANATIRDLYLKDSPDELKADAKKYKGTLWLYPMSQWYLYSEFKNGFPTGGRIQFVWLFGIVGIFVLLLACINFMNLSTARSEKRAKEVGIRKAIGSQKMQLINQFMSESFLVVFLAFVLSILLVFISLAPFNELAGKTIELPLGNVYFWLANISFLLTTALLSGLYPSFYLSSFQPIKVLKGTIRLGKYAAVPRKVLVVVQFTVSVILIIGTVIVFQQIKHAQNRPVGYNRSSLLRISMDDPNFSNKKEVLRAELLASGAVSDVAFSGMPLTAIWDNWGGFRWKGKNPESESSFSVSWINEDFGKTIGWKVKQGRDYSKEYATDSAAVIINESAANYLGLKNPIGEFITHEESGQRRQIIGVVSDLIANSPYEPVKIGFYWLEKNLNHLGQLQLKISPNLSAGEALTKIEAIQKKLVPSAPFQYNFVDDEYGKKFSSEQRIGKLAAIFAVLAIFISCLGLFGMASFVAEQRTKEIGIRKVLGASVSNLWQMLSKDFVLLVLLSCLIASPIAYYYLNNWLTNYNYHIEISWWIFAASALGALGITLLTVSFQAIKAALMNPVKSLKSE
jgi:ABC-type antimicrobial peptide transport system permease subunit